MIGFSFPWKRNFILFWQMSLYIGNLSARTRRDELEYFFGRFGHCNVQLKKDGYGFVVFDYPPDAEKALRALQGRNICGEPLTLTWSNKQPQPFRKFARGARSYELLRGRNAARGGDYASRKMGSNGWRDYRMGIKQLDSDGRRLDSADMLDDETGYHQDNIKDNVEEELQGLHDEDRSIVANLDNDRWVGRVLERPYEKGVENGLEFDRYEPYKSYDEKAENENQRMGYTGVSPATRSSQENLAREQIDTAALNCSNDSKPRQTCFSCGASGHKIRNCPRKHASRRKSTKFDLKQDYDIDKSGRGKGEVNRFGSKSWGKLRSNRDTMSVSQQRDDRRASGSRNHRREINSITQETDRDWRKDYGGKKRREIVTPTRSIAKKARRSIASPDHSDYTSRSRSTFQSSKSVPKSSRSRSAFSRAHSLSSNLRSSSKSHYSGSRSCKSRSRLSSPSSVSMSVSLGRPSPFSPNKVQLNLKGSLYNASTPESKDILVEQVEPVDGDKKLEKAKLENTMMVVNNEYVLSSSKVEDDMEKDQHLEREDKGNHIASGSLYEVTNPSTPLSEKGALTGGNSSPEMFGEMMEFQNSGALEMEHMQEPIKKPDSETLVNSQTGHSTSMSLEEMYKVLKHYGLELSEENEGHLSVEAYFGSARLWPWEIIYYRRQKKGPVSIENYARRVVQNEEFGIVDKYIRSSSGWGEMDKENF
jgi:RNA recognition motif-containing protein